MTRDDPKLIEALTALLESQQQAEHDFVGEQREWHLPRLNRAASLLIRLFPREAGLAMTRAKNPWGDLLCADDE